MQELTEGFEERGAFASQAEESPIGGVAGLLLLLGVTLAYLMMAGADLAHAASLSGKDVMTRNEDARKIDDVNSDATLTVGGGGSAEKVKQFTWWRKLLSDRVHFNTLTRFHLPAEVRGEGILFLEHDGDNNDVQMYLPAYKKIRRVESQAQSGSFMGSEFSYADIATPHVDDYKYELQKEDAPCEIDGGKKSACYLVLSTPVSDDVKERTGYSKTLQWIRKDNFIAVQGEFYDADGALWKKMKAGDIHEVDTAKHKWMSYNVHLENAKNGKYTTLQFAAVKVNTGIPDSTFTQQNLSRER
jgi:outer membrane lipoprotein-sorting protein